MDKIVLDAGEEPKVPSIMGMFKTIKEVSESPLGKVGLKVLEKELGVDKVQSESVKKPFGRALYALRDFFQGTWWVAVAFSFCMMIIFVIYLWLKSRLGLG